MYFARGRGNRKIVQADSANAWGDYVCPTCKAEVFLRAGKKRDWHFAHYPRQGTPECELFHPSNDLARTAKSTPVVVDAPHIDPLRVSLDLEPDHSSRSGPRKWRVCITLPKSPDGRGKLSFEFGSGDIREVSLSKLALQAQTYQVSPDTIDYGVKWFSPEVHPAYKAVLEHRTIGLNRFQIVAFDASRQKLKPQSRAFCWGESYYFVWHEQSAPHFPPGLLDYNLAVEGGWTCALVTLPLTSDPEVETWLREWCDRPILRARREWCIVFPAPYNLDDGAIHQIEPSSNILVALSAPERTRSELSVATSHDTASLTLDGAGQFIVELTSTATKPLAAYLGWNGEHMVGLVQKPFPKGYAGPHIELEVRTPEGVKRAALHEMQGASLLADIRASRSELLNLRAPYPLAGELHTRQRGGIPWATQPLVLAQNDGTYSLLDPDRLQAALRQTEVDLTIDYGAFGRFEAAGKLPLVAHSGARQSLPPELRRRIEWLCRLSSASPAPSRPFHKLDGDALLLHFKQMHVPAELAAHRRALEIDLNRTTTPRVSS